MNQVYLGIGSNTNRQNNIASCLLYLSRSFKICVTSPTYRSASFGFAGEDFYNLAVLIETVFDPVNLKKWLQHIEDLHQRDRTKPRYSDRTLDIDLLLFNEAIIDDGFVQVPRREICRRKYVLKPLCDLAPNLIHPTQQKRLSTLWKALDAADNSRLEVVK